MAAKNEKMDIDVSEPVPEAPWPPAAPGPRNGRRMRRGWSKILAALILVLVLAALAYYFVQYQRLSRDPAVVARAEDAKVIQELSKVMVVPNDPSPVIATVSDKSKLADQPFFAQAQNGDQVIIFPVSMKAVLYRPSARKIIDIAPLATGASASAAAPSPVPAKAKAAATSTTP
ncbi:MAG: hypothetical protein WDN10_04490 [bacterium]